MSLWMLGGLPVSVRRTGALPKWSERGLPAATRAAEILCASAQDIIRGTPSFVNIIAVLCTRVDVATAMPATTGLGDPGTGETAAT